MIFSIHKRYKRKGIRGLIFYFASVLSKMAFAFRFAQQFMKKTCNIRPHLLLVVKRVMLWFSKNIFFIEIENIKLTGYIESNFLYDNLKFYGLYIGY